MSTSLETIIQKPGFIPKQFFDPKVFIPFSGLVYSGCKAISGTFKELDLNLSDQMVEDWKWASRLALRSVELATITTYNEVIFSLCYALGYELSQKIF